MICLCLCVCTITNNNHHEQERRVQCAVLAWTGLVGCDRRVFGEQGSVELRWWLSLVWWETRLLWILSWASIIVSVFNYMLSFATLMFTGHLGALELAGTSIANVGIQGLAYGIMNLLQNDIFIDLCKDERKFTDNTLKKACCFHPPTTD
ncbi:hypothetical protein Q3G72_022499 [Acer saccharum]|nr:hypothetical protein Q3G72_022499 [Acer saccharum]